VSRINRGKIQMHKQRVDLVAVLTEAVDLARPLLEAAGQSLTLALPHEPLTIEGDVARLAQVFGNVLNNASKFTGRNGVIWVSAERKLASAVIRIRDNGQGIPPHMLSAIFEMFQQVDGSLERSHGGLGIGLTLVKRMIEEHHGTVEAFSEGPGRGSEFVIMLPLLKPAQEKPTDGAPCHGMAQFTSIPAHRILVVDDVKASAHTLAMMLRALGQEVFEAYSGLEGIASAHEHKPDVAFLDIAMPEMNGYEVARRLRTENPEVMLAAVTGYGQDDDRRTAFEAGFHHHLVKPTSMEALERILMTVPSKSN
ncbi:MAG TPA: ATP-binding protein, partial [Pirellulales bacterium]